MGVERLTSEQVEDPSALFPKDKSDKQAQSGKRAGGDPEIERLCNLGALNSKYFSDSTSKMARKGGKKGGAKPKSKKANGAAAEVDLTAGSDSDVSEVVEVNGRGSGKNDNHRDRAKDDVLADSSDTADEAEGDGKAKRKKGEAAAKKGAKRDDKPASKKKLENEKFMRVQLDVSDSSDNEEKASKRQDKLKEEMNDKKKKRSKNALTSSDDEIVEIKEGK